MVTDMGRSINSGVLIMGDTQYQMYRELFVHSANTRFPNSILQEGYAGQEFEGFSENAHRS